MPFGSGYLFTADFSGFSHFFLVNASVTLPVTLLTFTGKVENTAALLNWSTSAEQNAKNFVVEKAADGIHFTPLGVVNAAGNSTVRKDYSFQDGKLSRLNYYRLQMHDRDGHSRVSNVVLLQYNAAGQKVWVLNNPFTNFIDLRMAKDAAAVRLQLIGSNGTLLAEQTWKNVSGQLHWQLNRDLSAGTYLLRSTVDGKVYTFKLVKQ